MASGAGELQVRDLASAMETTLSDIIEFVTTPEFRAVYQELNELPAVERPDFVESVLLDDRQLTQRGIEVPEGVLIQRSAFGDRRPTLFCVVKYLPDEYRELWDKMTVTFDQAHGWEDIPTGPQAWREPLHPAELANLLSMNFNTNVAGSYE